MPNIGLVESSNSITPLLVQLSCHACLGFLTYSISMLITAHYTLQKSSSLKTS